jgi:hypothetical protein
MLGHFIIQFLTAVRRSLIQEAPPEYQACESCRESHCDITKAETCEYRLQAEREEESRREVKLDHIT